MQINDKFCYVLLLLGIVSLKRNEEENNKKIIWCNAPHDLYGALHHMHYIACRDR